VDKRLQKSENDLISLLVDNQLKAGRLQKADVTQIAFLLLVAGNATMISMIALGIVTALEHPEQLEDLKSEPEKWSPKFVEELCRYHTASALATKRVAKEDINLGGKLIKKGEGIIAATQSGNRDEEVFPKPDVFDMKRERRSEEALGYGWGEHRCVAEWLARAELEIVFGMSRSYPGILVAVDLFLPASIFKKLPDLKLAIPFEEVKYSPPHKDVGISELSVVF
jgi:nitric oxide reductase